MYVVGFLVRRDHAHLGAELDREVADGKPSFDRQVADRAAGIFDRIAGAAGGADVADQGKDQILGGDAERQLALELDAHGFGPALDQRLRRQHMRQFARADAERQRAEPAMGAGMAVAADDQAAGKAQAQFGPDDMDDALPGLVDVEQLDAAGRGLDPQRRQQFQPDLAGAGAARRRRDRVVRRREGQFRIVDGEVAALEVEQAARAAEIVQQMTIDMQQIGIVADACE